MIVKIYFVKTKNLGRRLFSLGAGETVFYDIGRTFFMPLFAISIFHSGIWWGSLLRHVAASWKVAGSIPEEVIGIFH